MVGPVIWKAPFGRLAALVMRVSTTRAGSPVAPVVSRKSCDGSMSVSDERSRPVTNGGAVVRCALGAPEVLGGGSVAYGVLLAGATQKPSWAAACACADSAKFGPGVPSAFTIPFDRRFDTVWPAFGTYVPKAWSKVRFSPSSTMTCLMGVMGCGSEQITSTDWWALQAG